MSPQEERLRTGMERGRRGEPGSSAARLRTNATVRRRERGLGYLVEGFLATFGLATFAPRPVGAGASTTAADPPSSRSASHCCSAVSRFITVQYSTSPDGRL